MLSRVFRLYVHVGWIILPVVAAGIMHVVVLKLRLLPSLATPIDRGAHWRGRPIFGQNKTLRGFLLMPVLTGCFTSLQSLVERRASASSPMGSPTPHPWMAGSLVGLAYCVGVLPNSFVKRRLGVRPGYVATNFKSLQYIVDQTDSVLSCLLVLRRIRRLGRREQAAGVLLGSVIHIGVDLLMYGIGIKRRGR